MLPPASYPELPPKTPSPLDQALLRQLRELVGRYLANPDFDVGRAAAMLNLSERTLYRRFRKLTGLTPASYLRALRLDYARDLLVAGRVASVTEAAFAVGIEDTDYFARLFFQRFGQRVSEYFRPDEAG